MKTSLVFGAALALIVLVSAPCSSSSPSFAPTVTVTGSKVTVAGPTVRSTQTIHDTATVVRTQTQTLRPTVNRVVATRTRTETVTYTPPPPRAYSAGEYLIGRDIQAGTFETDGSSDCYWARLSGLSGDLGDIIANHIGPGQQIVDVSSSDKAFEIQGSCTFHRA